MSKDHSKSHVHKAQYPHRYVPAETFYSPIEPAFQTCGPVNVIPYALGPISRVLGSCAKIHGDSGMCWGAFLSHHVDGRDQPAGCLYSENSVQAAHAMSREDPAGNLKHHTGGNLMQRDAQQSYMPCENWGPCASFGSYSECPNCSLGSNAGNSVLGQSATPWCKTQVNYTKPFPKNQHQPAHLN